MARAAIGLLALLLASTITACSRGPLLRCRADRDCGDAGTCDNTRFDASMPGLCVFSCTRQDDCPSGYACGPISDGGATCWYPL